MKVVFAIAVLVAVVQALPQGPHGPPPATNEDCIRETGVNRDQLISFEFNKLDSIKELRCYRRCVDIKDGRILENNMPNTDSPQMLEKLPPGADIGRVKKAATECLSKTASVRDPCDNWLAMMKCVSKKFGH